MKVMIDRFEGDYALVELEDLDMVEIPRRLLPSQAREGDVISISIDQEETEERRRRIERKFRSLFDD